MSPAECHRAIIPRFFFSPSRARLFPHAAAADVRMTTSVCPPWHQALLISTRGHLAESNLHLLAPSAGLENWRGEIMTFKLPI